MKKMFLSILASVLVLMPVNGTLGANVELPIYATDGIPDLELVEPFCYQAKFQAGEGLASIRALNDELVPLYNELRAELEGLGDDYYIETIEKLAKITNDTVENDICGAANYGDALTGISNLEYNPTYSILKEGKEQFRERLSQKVNEETEKIKIQLEEQLQKEADELKEAKEAELRQKAKEIEAEKRRELDVKIAQLKAAAQRGEYGSPPSDPDQMEAYMARVKQEVTDQVNAEAERLETQLRTQLDQEIERFEAQIRAELEKKAEELTENKKRSLDVIKTKFEGLDSVISATTAKYKVEYDGFEAKFYAKKKDLMKRSVRNQIEKAKTQIADYDDDIALAKEHGIEIKTRVQLEAELDAEAQKLINYIDSQKDVTTEDLHNRGLALVDKWSEIQAELMRALEMSGRQVYEQVQVALRAGGVAEILQEQIGRSGQIIKYFEDALGCQGSNYAFECQDQDRTRSMLARWQQVQTEVKTTLSKLDSPVGYYDKTAREALVYANELKAHLNDLKNLLEDTRSLQERFNQDRTAWIQVQSNK